MPLSLVSSSRHLQRAPADSCSCFRCCLPCCPHELRVSNEACWRQHDASRQAQSQRSRASWWDGLALLRCSTPTAHPRRPASAASLSLAAASGPSDDGSCGTATLDEHAAAASRVRWGGLGCWRCAQEGARPGALSRRDTHCFAHAPAQTLVAADISCPHWLLRRFVLCRLTRMCAHTSIYPLDCWPRTHSVRTRQQPTAAPRSTCCYCCTCRCPSWLLRSCVTWRGRMSPSTSARSGRATATPLTRARRSGCEWLARLTCSSQALLAALFSFKNAGWHPCQAGWPLLSAFLAQPSKCIVHCMCIHPSSPRPLM